MRQILCTELVGRDDDMSVLRSALQEARAGQGNSVAVIGEAGVGKSRLIREVEALARQGGFQILRGRAVEGAGGAYRSIAEALLSRLRSIGSGFPAGITDLDTIEDLKPFRPVLGRLIPEWRRDDVRLDESNPTVLLGEAILRLLRVLGVGQGCCMILEDLHWADADTVSVIEYLTDNLREERVLLLATIRTDPQSAALHWAHRMAARRVGRVLELHKLDPENVETMARLCLEVATCPDAVADRLSSYTEGLPFLVEELLAAWMESGALVRHAEGLEVAATLQPIAPLTFADTVNHRLGALGEETGRLLRAAAILGRHFDWTILPQATGQEEGIVLERLRRAIEAQLLTANDQAATTGHTFFGFRHALTRSAVLAELLPPERAALSAHMLEVVETVHPGLPGEWADLAAGLAETAGNTVRAAELLLQSGRRASARGALATAENTFDRARQLAAGITPLSIEIEEALTDVLSLAGKWERALDVGERLLATLRNASAPPERQVDVHLHVARAALAASQWDRAADHLDQARRLAIHLERQDLFARLDALAAHLAIDRAQLDEASSYAQAALEEAERAALPDVACEALEVLGRCARVNDLDKAEAAFDRARAVAEENGLTVCRIRALHELGTIDIFQSLRLDRLQEARDLALNAGALATAAMVDVQIAACLDHRSDLEGVLAASSRAAEMARRLHLDVTAAAALLFQSQALARLGRRAEMETALAEALHLAGSEPDIIAGAWESRAFAAILDEDWSQVSASAENAVAAVERMPATTPAPYYGLWALMRTVRDAGGQAACEYVRRSGATINPVNRAYIGYAEAINLGRQGRIREAAATASRADSEAAGMDWFRHCGRRVMAEAAIKGGWGDPALWLWETRDYFEGKGQTRLVSACTSLLRQIGTPAPYTHRSHADVPAPFRSLGVTRREMEVLSVLVEGLSNKEIGERLYLSPRTVEKHIASLLAKTGTHARTQLVALAVSAAASS